MKNNSLKTKDELADVVLNLTKDISDSLSAEKTIGKFIFKFVSN